MNDDIAAITEQTDALVRLMGIGEQVAHLTIPEKLRDLGGRFSGLNDPVAESHAKECDRLAGLFERLVATRPEEKSEPLPQAGPPNTRMRFPGQVRRCFR